MLLCAPAGFGKSTALSSALAEWREGPVATVRVDDLFTLPRLLRRLIEALDPFDLPWGLSPDMLPGLAAQPESRRQALHAFCHALAGLPAGRGVIAVDDAHRINDPDAWAFVSQVMQQVAQRWTFALSSRVNVPGLARLRVAGALAEFRQEQLAFGVEELRAELGSEGAEDLVARTGGWPVAVMLCRMQGPRPLPQAQGHRQQRLLFDFLAEEVFADLPADLQDFLLRCSVLHELDPQVCALLTGDPASAAQLQDIDRRQLFVQWVQGADGEERLRLHDLFRDFLQQTLSQRFPDDLPALRLRAAELVPSLARRIDLQVSAGRADLAVRSLAEQGLTLVARAAGDQLLDHMSRLPAALRESSPDLLFLKGACLMQRGYAGVRPATDLLLRAARGFEAAGDAQAAMKARALSAFTAFHAGDWARADEDPLRPGDPPPDSASALLLDHAGWLRAWVLGDSGGAVRRLRNCVDRLDADPTLQPWLSVFYTSYGAAGYPGIGPLLSRLAWRMCQADPDEQPYTHGKGLALRAWLALWRGDIEAAAGLADDAAEFARWLGNAAPLQFPVNATQGVLAHLAGDVERSEHWLERSTSIDHLPYLPLACMIANGRLRQAAALLEQQAPRAQSAGRSAWFSVGLARAELALAEGDDAAALAFLRHCEADAERYNVWAMRDRARVAWARAELRAGRPEAASTAVAPTLAAAAASGDVLGLLVCGPAALQELADGGLALAPGEAAVLARCLADSLRWRHAAPRAVAAPQAGPVISPREQEVLALITEGQSNKLIARALGLSPNTVKRHVARMLERTGQRSRHGLAAWALQGASQRGAEG